MEQKKVAYLELGTNAAVILLALAIVGTLALNHYERTRLPGLSPGLKKGHTLKSIPGTDHGASPRTVLIALNTKCFYCEESIPFYDDLMGAQKSSGSSTRVLAVFPNTAEEVGARAERHPRAGRV